MSRFIKDREKQRIWTGLLHLLIAAGAGIGTILLAVKTYVLRRKWR